MRFSCIFSHRSWKTEVFVVSFILSIWAYSFYRFLNIIYQTIAKGKTDKTVSVSAAFNSFDSFYNELTTASSTAGNVLFKSHRDKASQPIHAGRLREEDMAIMLLMLQSFSLTCWRKKIPADFSKCGATSSTSLLTRCNDPIISQVTYTWSKWSKWSKWSNPFALFPLSRSKPLCKSRIVTPPWPW